MSQSNTMVILVSNDKQEFQVEKQVVLQSILIKNILEDLDQEETPTIPLPNIKGQTLKKVLEYCEQHRDDEVDENKSEEERFDVSKLDKVISEWDKSYIDVEDEDLFEIILAANYLDIKSLMELGCRTVTNKLKGKSPQEIREIFGIENDLDKENELEGCE